MKRNIIKSVALLAAGICIGILAMTIATKANKAETFNANDVEAWEINGNELTLVIDGNTYVWEE